MKIDNVGLIGCGLMGSGIGFSVLKRNYRVYITKHDGNKNVDILTENGAIFVKSLEEISKKCEIIILCLPDADAVEKVICTSEGLINHLKKGTIIIDTTTSHPKVTENIYKKLLLKGIGYADAPLTRSPNEAMLGKLNVIIGAEQEIYNKVLPILEAFSDNIFYAGDVGNGHKLKLLNNFICMSFAAIVEYAVLCGKKLNLDLDLLDSIMSTGTNYIATIPLIIKWLKTEDSSILNFSLKNATKDMRYFFELINDSNNKKFFSNLLSVYETASTDINFKEKTLPYLYDFFENNEMDKHNCR